MNEVYEDVWKFYNHLSLEIDGQESIQIKSFYTKDLPHIT